MLRKSYSAIVLSWVLMRAASANHSWLANNLFGDIVRHVKVQEASQKSYMVHVNLFRLASLFLGTACSLRTVHHILLSHSTPGTKRRRRMDTDKPNWSS